MNVDNKKTNFPEIIPTGFSSLDKALEGGIRRGSLTVIGARPGMGKTSLLRQISNNIGKQKQAENGWVVFADDFGNVSGPVKTFFSYRMLRKLKKSGGTVFITVKLPRKLEKRKDKRPVRGDFKKGPFGLFGAERQADNVIALYREAYYDPTDKTDPQNGELILLKKNGAVLTEPQTIKMRFDIKRDSACREWSEKKETV